VPPPAALAALHEFDLAIFVSPTAVAKAMPHDRAWPERVRVAAVGAGTRRALEKHGIANVIAPTAGADSEALLATREVGDVAGKRIAILRGDGGRALLGDTFIERGANVEYVTCYRRLLPKPPGAPVEARRAGGGHRVVEPGSGESIRRARSRDAALDAAVRAAMRASPSGRGRSRCAKSCSPGIPTTKCLSG
jgi:uroporphyrinogen-III synthase